MVQVSTVLSDSLSEEYDEFFGSSLPIPRTLTKEDRQAIRDQVQQRSTEFAKRARKLTNLTAEDWASRVR